MNQSVLLSAFLPAALAVIMLGLGLSLTRADFARVLAYPRAVGVALVCQTLVLPLVCVGIAHLFGLAPALAVGLMLLAASPGGTTANLYSHLAHGDVALNITLTAVNSLLALATLPIIVNLSLQHFFGEGKVIPLQYGKVLQVVAIVLVPVAAGMWIHARYPAPTRRMAKPVRVASIVFVLATVALVAATQATALGKAAGQIGLAALTFNVVSLVAGYYVALLAKLDQRQATAIGMEIGIHNGTLAITIAMSPLLLDNPTMALPAAIYSLIAFVTAAVFAALVSRGNRVRRY